MVKNQQAMKIYGVTSTESHIKNSLLIDMPVWVCKEDMERLGFKEDQMITDAEELGAELKTKFVSFAAIQKEMESVKHLLFF
jgi:sulfur relay (sulfurtransferase) DsrF/TusC family protein